MKKDNKIISGRDLLLNASGKLNRNDGIVKSGTGYHQDIKKYNRKSKINQQLKNSYKEYGSEAADFYYSAEGPTLKNHWSPSVMPI